MHTSAKARLTSVAIRIRTRIPSRDPDRHQNLNICSLAHCQPSLKIACKSVQKFLRKVANRQTDRQTDRQRRLHILLGIAKSLAVFHLCEFREKVRDAYDSVFHYGRPAQQMRTLYFCPVISFYLSFFIPRLISAASDWMPTILPHMVWP